MGKLTDSHTHRFFDPSDPALRIYSFLKPGAMPTDFPALFSLGIHPQKIAESPSLSEYEPLFQHKNCAAIGECGLDRRSPVSMAEQTALFLRHAELAEKVRKPLVIHMVRSQSELLHCKKDFSPTVPWILHGSRGSERKLMELADAGFYLSFGEGLLRDEGNIAPFFARLPLERMLFETDESAVSLEQIAASAASLLQLSVLELNDRIEQNFRRVFLHER